MSPSATEVESGIHRFTHAGVNWYLMEEDSGWWLVDCGWPASRDSLLGGLREADVATHDLRGVLLTHGHPDHLGTAAWLYNEHGVQVLADPDELPRVRGERPSTRGPSLLLNLWRPTTLRFIGGSIAHGVLRPEWVPSVREVAAADLAGVAAVATPGHTEGHTAYHLTDRGILFSGDSLVTRDVLTGATGPRLHPAPFQVDLQAARRSLEVLADVDAHLILPGHGEPFVGTPAEAVEQALQN
jgi:glyoxylase-like metal-dependent hydrolase (beta-lactamase superfamily II)